MADEQTIPTWGYSATDAKIFDLKPGESLPDGFFDHPAKVVGSEAWKFHRDEADREGAPNLMVAADAPPPPSSKKKGSS